MIYIENGVSFRTPTLKELICNIIDFKPIYTIGKNGLIKFIYGNGMSSETALHLFIEKNSKIKKSEFEYEVKIDLINYLIKDETV